MCIRDRIWYEQFVADNSAYIYAGGNPGETDDTFHNTTPVATGFSTSSGGQGTPIPTNDGTWGLDAQGVTFNAIGNIGYKLLNGNDYSSSVQLGAGTTFGGFSVSLGDLMTSYDEFSNNCLLYTSPSPRDLSTSRMPSSA